MQRLLILCCLGLLPMAAHADTLTFTLDQTIIWSLPLPLNGVAVNAQDLRFLNFPIDFNGHQAQAQLDLFSSPGGGFNLTYFYPGGPGHVIGQGPQLFSGTTDDPTILLGDFTLADGKGFDILSITSDAPAPTPEPSTFALLGTGLLGAVAALRRRPTIR